jgi:hypothetical protein
VRSCKPLQDHSVRKPAASRTHDRLKSGQVNLFTYFAFGVSRSGISINSIYCG